MIHVEFELSYVELAQGIAAALAVTLAIVLAALVRRRWARERAHRNMLGTVHDFFPTTEHSAIEEIRREVDASHRQYEHQRLEEDWKRGGCVTLEKRIGA